MVLNMAQDAGPFLTRKLLPTVAWLSAGTTATPAAYFWATALNQNRFLFAGDATVPGGSRGILGFNAWDTTGRTAYAMNYALEIERQIGKEYAAQASYVGTLGRKLVVFLDPNEPCVTVVDHNRR